MLRETAVFSFGRVKLNCFSPSDGNTATIVIRALSLARELIPALWIRRTPTGINLFQALNNVT
jgi:hypothetical protein